MEGCTPWKEPLLATRKENDEKEVAETNCKEQTTALVPPSLQGFCVCAYVGVEESGMTEWR